VRVRNLRIGKPELRDIGLRGVRRLFVFQRNFTHLLIYCNTTRLAKITQKLNFPNSLFSQAAFPKTEVLGKPHNACFSDKNQPYFFQNFMAKT
jgi:hypothetical protein